MNSTRAFYAIIRESGNYKTMCTVKPGESTSRRAILSRSGLPLKNHSVILESVDGEVVVAK